MTFNTIPYVNYELPTKVNHIFYLLDYRFKYIPYILLEDIANVISHWHSTGKPGGYIGINSEFGIKYKNFLYSIPFDLYNETTPYKKAVEIIKSLSNKYNFREIEKAIVLKQDDYDFAEIENAQNPLIDISLFNDDVKELVNINAKDYISLDIINMLRLTEDFNKTFSNNTSKELSKMRTYSQIKDLSKYKLKLPSFQYKYTLKNYHVKQGNPKEIVLFRDASFSARTLDKTFKSLLLYFINSYKGKTIRVHEFTNTIKETHVLKSLEDIKEYYNKDINRYLETNKFLPNFIKEYSECYLIVSGAYDVYPKTLNCVINGISLKHNESLNRLCNNTKGKYLAV